MTILAHGPIILMTRMLQVSGAILGTRMAILILHAELCSHGIRM